MSVRVTSTELHLVIQFTEPVYTEALTDGLGEWMRELEAGDGFAKLGIADWRFQHETPEKAPRDEMWTPLAIRDMLDEPEGGWSE